MGKVKRRCHESYHLPEAFLLASILAEKYLRHQEGPWVRVIGQGQPGNSPHHHKMQDREPRGSVFLLSSSYLAVSTWAAPTPSTHNEIPWTLISHLQCWIRVPFWFLDGVAPSCNLGCTEVKDFFFQDQHSPRAMG